MDQHPRSLSVWSQRSAEGASLPLLPLWFSGSLWDIKVFWKSIQLLSASGYSLPCPSVCEGIWNISRRSLSCKGGTDPQPPPPVLPIPAGGPRAPSCLGEGAGLPLQQLLRLPDHKRSPSAASTSLAWSFPPAQPGGVGVSLPLVAGCAGSSVGRSRSVHGLVSPRPGWIRSCLSPTARLPLILLPAEGHQLES